MIRFLIGLSLESRVLVAATAVGLIILGFSQLPNMPVDLLPEFAPPSVEVQTEALGLSTEEVEQLITAPMEELLHGVPWVVEIRSESVPGLSSIVLTFEPGTELIRARQMVQERLTQTRDLPNVSSPPTMIQPLSSTSRVMIIGLSSEELSLIDMSLLAHWTIRPHLMGVSGVANVAIWGQREYQLQVQVDPARLADHDLSLFHIVEAAGNAPWVSPLTFLEGSVPGTGGFIDTANQRLGIRHVSPILTPRDLARVPVRTEADGKVLKLGDVTNVLEDHQPLIGDAIINSGPGLMLVVEKFPWANTLEVTKGVEEALVALQPGLTGIEVDTTLFRPATFIEMAIDNLKQAFLVGFVLVALVLALFLYEWRTAIVSIMAILLSLVGAVLVLYLMDATANVMLLAGLVIAVGVVIDDAIIDIEYIGRRRRQHRQEDTGQPTASIILRASLEIRGPMVFATLIILAGLFPLLFNEGLTAAGLSSAFFRPLGLSYALAVIASMLVALTVTPALALLFLSNAPLDKRESSVVRWLRHGYGSILPRFIQNPGTSLAGPVALVLLGIAITPLLTKSLIPHFQERHFLIRWEAKAGTSLPGMRRVTSRAIREIESIYGVHKIVAHIGRAVMSDQVSGISSSEIWLSLEEDTDYDSTLELVQNIIDGYPGFNGTVLSYSSERMREVLKPPSDDVTLRIYGEDRDFLQGKAVEVSEFFSNLPGVDRIQVEFQREEPTLEIEVDLAAAQAYGVKPGDVRRAAAILITGIGVGSLFEEQKVFGVVVKGTPELRNSLTSVAQLLIDIPANSQVAPARLGDLGGSFEGLGEGNEFLTSVPSGNHVRLGDVADIRVAPNPEVIRRESGSRYIDIGFEVKGREVSAVEDDLKLRLQEVYFPVGYHAEVLVPHEERHSAQIRMLVFALLAVVGILVLLQAAFGSWRLALMVFATLPMALVGALVGLLADGGVLSFGALVGFLAVVGIATRNGTMLINHFQHLEREEGEALGPGLVLRGARERLAPILLTAVATGLALLPLVVLGEIPGSEIAHPTAVVILGGLVSSTLINLFILPSLYLRVASSRGDES